MFLVVYLINANYFVVERLKNSSDEDSDVVFWSLIMNAFIVCFVIGHMYDEGKQLIVAKLKYFSSIWNIIDVFLVFFALVTTTFDIMSCLEVWNHPESLKSLHAFTIFLGYLRILSFARGIEGSSFMVKLIIEVLYDIRYFLLLMFIFIFALTSSGAFIYLF